jgi:glycosyltransferase involved in cell wall biosynthesis
MRAVHQLLASIAYGDAISNEALVIRDHLRRAGYASDIFVEERETRMAPEVRLLDEYEAVSGPDTVCLFHFSIGGGASRVAFHAKHRLVLIYHNITPASAFVAFHPHLARRCEEGRRELAAFAPRAELALADSSFNRGELDAAGYARTAVLPIVLDLDRYARPKSPVIRRLYGPDRKNIVFVGRVIPSKRIEDLLRTFAVFQRHVERRSRLLIVGDYRGHERYYSRLLELTGTLKLRDVVFTGRVEEHELRAYYAAADAFLCLSEHEGFCVPLLEAMLFNVPTVAFATGAVEETMDGAGVLLLERDPEAAAEVLGQLLHNEGARASILRGQEQRIARLRSLDFGRLLMERLSPVLGAAAVPA